MSQRGVSFDEPSAEKVLFLISFLEKQIFSL
jgi:hypothetical protein